MSSHKWSLGVAKFPFLSHFSLKRSEMALIRRAKPPIPTLWRHKRLTSLRKISKTFSSQLKGKYGGYSSEENWRHWSVLLYCFLCSSRTRSVMTWWEVQKQKKNNNKNNSDTQFLSICSISNIHNKSSACVNSPQLHDGNSPWNHQESCLSAYILCATPKRKSAAKCELEKKQKSNDD